MKASTNSKTPTLIGYVIMGVYWMLLSICKSTKISCVDSYMRHGSASRKKGSQRKCNEEMRIVCVVVLGLTTVSCADPEGGGGGQGVRIPSPRNITKI